MSRIVNSEPKIRNFQTLVPKNAISYRMSPPYTIALHCLRSGHCFMQVYCTPAAGGPTGHGVQDAPSAHAALDPWLAT